MAVDRFAAYILAPQNIFGQFYSKKCPPKSVVETVPKWISLFSLNLRRSPEKGQNMLFQLEKLAANWSKVIYIYTHTYVATHGSWNPAGHVQSTKTPKKPPKIAFDSL